MLCWSAISENPPELLFHSTEAPIFIRFDDARLGQTTDNPSGLLGHFFSAHPEIARSFVLNEEIVDHAYDTLAGSSVLLDRSWVMRHAHLGGNGQDLRPGGRVIAARMAPSRIAIVEAADLAGSIDDWEPGGVWCSARRQMIGEGFDALLIAGNPDAVDAGDLCVEYAADLWVALNPDIITILDQDWRMIDPKINFESIHASRVRQRQLDTAPAL